VTPLLQKGRVPIGDASTGEVVMKIDKEIERLRKATAVRAAHLKAKPETEDFIEDAFNASAKREALNLLQSAVSAEKHANIAA
jgi:hypothetical protein